MNHSSGVFLIEALINRELNREDQAPEGYRREGTAVCLFRRCMPLWFEICSTGLGGEPLIAFVF